MSYRLKEKPAARAFQIESGDVSTQDVLSRFVAALGGTLLHRRFPPRQGVTGT
jgi:hypothetical protein